MDQPTAVRGGQPLGNLPADAQLLGKGRLELLTGIDRWHSISEAARRMKMSYRQAWLLIDELNRMFREPLVTSQIGGGGGGGAALTKAGASVIRLYRDMEQRANGASSTDVRALIKLLA